MADDVGESFTLNWDESGQLKNIPYTGTTTALVYNWDGKLRKAAIDGNSIELKYDPAGNRIYTDSSVNGERKYIVDIIGDLPVILMELDPNNGMNIEKTYIYANGQILAQHDGDYTDSRYFYLHDRLGSVRQIINTSGNVVQLYTYYPFGEVAESDGTFANPWRFTGQWYDDEIDQYYLRARMYDPHIYRFTARDPVDGKFKQPITLHKYLYCGNNAINAIDPWGLWTAHVSLSSMLSFGWSIMGEWGLVVDDDGNFGMMWTSNFITGPDGELIPVPMGAGTPAVSVGMFMGWTNADEIFDLEGKGLSTGFSVGLPWCFGLTGVSGNFLKGEKYRGLEASLPFMNFGFAPAEVHTHVTETAIDFIEDDTWYSVKRALQETATYIEIVAGYINDRMDDD